jgi:hypothetical protein
LRHLQLRGGYGGRCWSCVVVSSLPILRRVELCYIAHTYRSCLWWLHRICSFLNRLIPHFPLEIPEKLIRHDFSKLFAKKNLILLHIFLELKFPRDFSREYVQIIDSGGINFSSC